MSTQVTYKGNTIANFTNDTKMLKTAGKYMEDDVAIVDVTNNVWQDENGYIILPPAGGGGGSSTWTWRGDNPTLVKDCGVIKVYLKDTGYATWTPTTTSTMIVDYANIDTYTGADFSTYDYLVQFKFHTHFDYGDGATGTAQILDYYYNLMFYSYAYCATYSDINTNTERHAISMSVTSISGMFYLNSEGINSFANNSYGVFPYSAYSPTLSKVDGTITPRLPQINARCSAAYFSTANAAVVNQNTSYFEYRATVYRVDRSTSDGAVLMREIRDMWLNGI